MHMSFMVGGGGEIERIRAAYARRDKFIPAERYSPLNPSTLFLIQERERRVLELLT